MFFSPDPARAAKRLTAFARANSAVLRIAAVVFLPAIAIPLQSANAADLARSPVADVGGHFGLHGPTYSHMQHGKTPAIWREGEILLDVLDETGAGWLRQDFWWSLAEPEKDRFEWDDFDRAVESYERHGCNVLAILCYSSAWSDGVCPQDDAERDRFANYVYEMVRRYQGKITAWEIWNEPNIQPFWSPRPDPKLYAKLLIAAYDAAKRADPDCVIVGGVFAGPDAAFLEGMYANGAASHFDVLSYHNYGQDLSIEKEYPAVKRLREVMVAHGEGDKPIWHTENGFFTGPVGLSEQDQSAWLVRYSIGLLALGIEKTFQLTLHDWTDDPTHHDLSVYRGITHADLRRKPSFAAYRTMCDRLNGRKFVAKIRPAPGVSGFLFQGEAESDTVLVLWRDCWDNASPSAIDLGAPRILVQQTDGDTQRLRSDSGVYDLSIGPRPLYVFDPGPAITRQALIRWQNPITDRLTRSRQAPISVTVRNSTESPLRLALSIPPSKPDATSQPSAMIPAGTTETFDLTLNTSSLSPGDHEITWTLFEEGANPSESAGVFATGFRRLQVVSPLRVFFESLSRLSKTDPALSIRVESFADKVIDVSGRFSMQGASTGELKPIQLSPRESTSIQLPLRLDQLTDGRRISIRAELTADDVPLSIETHRRLLRAHSAPENARIDGDLGEWTERTPSVTPEMFEWAYVNAVESPAPDDLKVTAWVAYDDRGLWVAVRAEDDAISLPQGRAVWNWDSLQVGLDMAADAQPDQQYDANDLEVELAYKSAKTAWCYLGYCPPGWPAEQLSQKLRGAVSLDKQTKMMAYELLIPAELLVSTTRLAPDTVMGLSMLVNDNDGDGRAGWLELTPGIGMGKHPSQFDWLWLR